MSSQYELVTSESEALASGLAHAKNNRHRALVKALNDGTGFLWLCLDCNDDTDVASKVNHEASEHFAATGHMPSMFVDDNESYVSWACKICDCNPELDRV